MQRIRIKCLPGSSFKLSGSHFKKNIKKIKKQEISYITGIITYQDKYLLIQNTPGGLLENLYGFVQYDVESPYSFVSSFQEKYHQELIIQAHIKDIKHVFSHRVWFMHVYHFVLEHEIEGMYTLEEIEALPLSTASTYKSPDQSCRSRGSS